MPCTAAGSDPHRASTPSLSASSVLLTSPAMESPSSYVSVLRKVLNTHSKPLGSGYFQMLLFGVIVGLWGFPSVVDLMMNWIW